MTGEQIDDWLHFLEFGCVAPDGFPQDDNDEGANERAALVIALGELRATRTALGCVTPAWKMVPYSHRVKGHRMRVKGRSWRAIGIALGYPWQTIRRAVHDHNGHGP